MKSSPILSGNQRVERITTSTLVVGIDVAKESHVAHAVNFRGIIVTKRPIRLHNSRLGFDYLVRSIRDLQRERGMNDVLVGMESTGHYFFALANYLVEQGIEVVLVNPATTKRNKENRDNTPSKSDPKDAAVIAEVVARGYYSPYRRKDPLYEQLTVLAKARDRISRDLTRAENRLHRWIDLYFPEYITVFKDVFCPRSLATLHAVPTPSDMKGLSPDDVVQHWSKQGMSRAGGKRGLAKAQELLSAAAHSIGGVIGLEMAKWDLTTLLEDYKRCEQRLKEAESQIAKLLHEIPLANTLRTVGITTNLCGMLLACAGDLSNYDHGDQLLRMAGLNLAERSSGKYRGQIKLSKRGSALLRKTLYLAVLHLLRQDATFRAWHERNITGKHMKPMQSMMKLIRKLARILVAMARKQEPFRPELATPLAA